MLLDTACHGACRMVESTLLSANFRLFTGFWRLESLVRLDGRFVPAHLRLRRRRWGGRYLFLNKRLFLMW